MNAYQVAEDRRAPSEHNDGRVGTFSLIIAELGRARRTRSTVALLLAGIIVALAVLITRAVLSGGGSEPLTSDVIALSADVVGFAVLFATALSIARDHQSGAIDLIRVLIPARTRHLAAHAAAGGVLALIAVAVVTITGIATLLVVAPSSLGDVSVFDSIARLCVTTVLLAYAGAGIGALCRSTAGATFVVLGLYLLLPIGLLVASFTGLEWAGPVSNLTLGVLASNAVSAGASSWLAVGGVAMWSSALVALGIARETKGE